MYTVHCTAYILHFASLQSAYRTANCELYTVHTYIRGPKNEQHLTFSVLDNKNYIRTYSDI